MIKPKIFLSKCFSYPVRYNGGIVHDEFIEKLKKFVDYELICPEMEIGLGMPRPKIIIKMINNEKQLFQPETGRNLTKRMREFTDEFIKKITAVDGFILKNKSPSCGLASANFYKNKKITGRTDGFFAGGIKNKFPDLPLEHESRLNNPELREHFLIRIFSLADFRGLKKESKPDALVQFHTKYKYLLMTYNQKDLNELGKIVADSRTGKKERIEKYKIIFYHSFNKKPSRVRHSNTILYIFGYLSKNLNQNEKKHFLKLTEKYKNGDIELNVILKMLKKFAYRFENNYLLNQRYINPFPEELL